MKFLIMISLLLGSAHAFAFDVNLQIKANEGVTIKSVVAEYPSKTDMCDDASDTKISLKEKDGILIAKKNVPDSKGFLCKKLFDGIMITYTIGNSVDQYLRLERSIQADEIANSDTVSLACHLPSNVHDNLNNCISATGEKARINFSYQETALPIRFLEISAGN